VPWALWGHSGGGHWAGGIVLLHPERVVAAWLRSGVPLLKADPKRATIKAHSLTDAALRVPMMCNLGTKEGVTVKDDRFSGVWPGNEAFFKEVRGKGGLIGVAVDPLTSHECGNQRYLAIPWLDVCLSVRLPKVSGEPLKDMPTDTLVRRDLVSKYKQTILGPLWHVIHPLVMALVFTCVFSRVAAISTEGAPRVLFYLAGLLAWNSFAQNLNTTSGTFTSNADLFGKVYFPRVIVPLASVMSSLIAVCLQFGVFLLFFMGYKLFASSQGYQIGWSVLLLPALVVQTAALSLGLGLWFSSLTTRYRDLQHAMPFVISIWMFLTPVFYPVSAISAGSRWLFQLNPMAAVVESYRHVLLGIGSVKALALGFSALITIAVLLSGMMLFQRAERTAVDTV
jgi:ABC-type polysaccharide/polyol phosphate export permease